MRNSYIQCAIALAAVALVGACTAQQVQTATNDAQVAATALAGTCAAVEQVKVVATTATTGGAANTVAAIGKTVDSVCGAVDTINAASKDPTTQAWLNGLGTALTVAAAAPAGP